MSEVPHQLAPFPTPTDTMNLMNLVGGYRVSKALHVVAQLGIADLLATGPKSSELLAAETGTHAETLFRVLRFLAGAGVFYETQPKLFALTSLGAALRSDVQGSYLPSALWLLGEHQQRSWPNLMHTLKTGETAFHTTYGMGPFAQLRADTENSALFNAAMTGSSARAVNELVARYDFSKFKTILDVGGNHGRTLGAILKANPASRGMLFDLPDVVAGAMSVLIGLDVSNRCEIVSGNFFEAVPKGADAYLLRQIIHDWNDADSIVILKNCRKAIPQDGRLLLIEREIVPNNAQAMRVLHFDLEMMVNVGGMERTEAQYKTLFEHAGFRLDKVVSLGDSANFAVFEGQPI